MSSSGDDNITLGWQIAGKLQAQNERMETFSQQINHVLEYCKTSPGLDRAVQNIANQLSIICQTNEEARDFVSATHQTSLTVSSLEASLVQQKEAHATELPNLRDIHTRELSHLGETHTRELFELEDAHKSQLSKVKDDLVKTQGISSSLGKRLQSRTFAFMRLCVRASQTAKQLWQRETEVTTLSTALERGQAAHHGFHHSKERLLEACQLSGWQVAERDALIRQLRRRLMVQTRAKATAQSQLSWSNYASEITQTSPDHLIEAGWEKALLIIEKDKALILRDEEIKAANAAFKSRQTALDDRAAALQARQDTEARAEAIIAEQSALHQWVYDDHYYQKYLRKVKGVDCPNCPDLRVKLEETQAKLGDFRKLQNELEVEKYRFVKFEFEVEMDFEERTATMQAGLEDEYMEMHSALDQEFRDRTKELDDDYAQHEAELEESYQDRAYELERSRGMLMSRCITAEMQVRLLESAENQRLQKMQSDLAVLRTGFNQQLAAMSDNVRALTERVEGSFKVVPEASKEVVTSVPLQVVPVLHPAQIAPNPTQVVQPILPAEAEEHAVVGGDDLPSSGPVEPPLLDDNVMHSAPIVSENALGKRPRSISNGSDQDSPSKRIRDGRECQHPPDVEISDPNRKVSGSVSQGEISSARDVVNGTHLSPHNAPPVVPGPSGQEQNTGDVVESERDAKIRRVKSMFVLTNFSLEEEAEFNGIISRGLTKRTADSFMAVVDKYCFGRLDKSDQAEDLPRRCFMAAVLGGQSSPLTGSRASHATCGKCNYEKTRCCYHLELLPGLATGFGPRLDNGRVDKANGGHQWNSSLEPRTLTRDGRQVRWVAKKR